MNIRNFENGLALIGAVIVLLGVTFAAGSALADEVSAERAVASVADAATDKSQAEANKANRKAAEAAVEGIAEDNKLDLEIRLLDRTSTIVARAR